MQTAKIKLKRCTICKGEFVPRNSLQKVCGIECAKTHAETLRIKRERDESKKARQSIKEDRKRLNSLKKGYYEGKAQEAINAYVRVRDHGKGCISCDKPHNWHGQWQAGHLKTRGANSNLRYHLWNINKQCSQCNNQLSGNVAEHERGIVARYGQERLDFLNTAPRLKRYDDDYLIRLAAVFRKRTRMLKKRKGL